MNSSVLLEEMDRNETPAGAVLSEMGTVCHDRRLPAPASFLFEKPFAEFLAGQLIEDVEGAELSSSFRTFYRVRGLIPYPMRRVLQRLRNGSAKVPSDWYLPRPLLKAVESLNGVEAIWPQQAQYAFVLTHDVETALGMRLILEVAEIEEQLGFRSSWNLVPHKYPIDTGIVNELSQRGFEIGIHGYNHDGRLFLSHAEFSNRVPAINEALQRYDAVGFRAPMVHRNLGWLQSLEAQYDASCFDVDPFQAMPGGVSSFWPFQIGHLIELPYTLPQDHTLLLTLGETTDRIWRDKLRCIRDCHGMALMLTHPDYLNSPQRLAVYRDFLEYVASEAEYWHVLPHEIASWSRQRLNGIIANPSFGITSN